MGMSCSEKRAQRRRYLDIFAVQDEMGSTVQISGHI